jgi:hypothetical protein
MMKVYISGPITSSGNQFDNVVDAIHVFRALVSMGYAVICPQLTAFADLGNQISHDAWMNCDKEIIEVMDVVLRMPGASIGAGVETNHATENSVDVWFSPTFGDNTPERIVELFTDEYPLE